MSAAEPQATQSETVRKHREFLFPAVATYYEEPLALVRGDGPYVWDDAGNRYLDCFGGVLTVSVGHASWEGESADELLSRADDALYAAKARGRDCVQGAPATLPRRR